MSLWEQKDGSTASESQEQELCLDKLPQELAAYVRELESQLAQGELEAALATQGKILAHLSDESRYDQE